jgi:cytoskeletal protein RodZ
VEKYSIMEKKKPSSFGRYLKTVRLEKGIKLSDIFQQTRISKVTLEQIEAEDHTQLPAEVFVKGFLRAYAGVVGADANVAVEGYLESRRLLGESVPFEPDGVASGSKSGSRILILLSIFIVIIAIAVFGMLAARPSKTDKPTKPDQSANPA